MTLDPATATVTTPAPTTTPPPPPHLPSPAGRRLRTLFLLCAIAGLWCTVVLASTRVDLSQTVRHYVKFVHLMSLTVGFGAVIAVDVCALAVLLGKRSPGFATRVAATVDPAVWGGYLGLILSGLLLEPNLNSAAMWVKLVAALVAGLNGALARDAMHRMLALPRGATVRQVPRPLMSRVAAHAAVSQAAWWTATVIAYFGSGLTRR